MPPCQLRLRPQPARRKRENLRLQPPPLRFGTLSPRQAWAAGPGMRPAPAAGSRQQAITVWIRSWLAQLLPAGCSISRPGRALPGQCAQFPPGERSCSASGLVRGPHRRADRGAAMLSSTPAAGMHKRCRDASSPPSVKDLIIDWRWARAGLSLERLGGRRFWRQTNGGWQWSASSAWTPNRYASSTRTPRATRLRCRGHLHPSLAAGAGPRGPTADLLSGTIAPLNGSVTGRRSGAPAAKQAHFKQLYAVFALILFALEMVCDKRSAAVWSAGSWALSERRRRGGTTSTTTLLLLGGSSSGKIGRLSTSESACSVTGRLRARRPRTGIRRLAVDRDRVNR